MNTKKSTDEDKTEGHWIACCIDKNDMTVEYFDPLADDIDSYTKRELMRIASQMDLENMFKLKVNRMKRQDDKSNLCGLHCIQFLYDRFNGQDFSQASGFDDYIKKNKIVHLNENKITKNFSTYL